MDKLAVALKNKLANAAHESRRNADALLQQLQLQQQQQQQPQQPQLQQQQPQPQPLPPQLSPELYHAERLEVAGHSQDSHMQARMLPPAQQPQQKQDTQRTVAELKAFWESKNTSPSLPNAQKPPIKQL